MGSKRSRHLAGGAALALAAVACSGSDFTSPSTGSLQVSAATSGEVADRDPDGYSAAVDGGTGRALLTNGVVTFAELAAGTHTASLSGLAPNCTVSGPNPMSVKVPAGATAQAAFQIACAPASMLTGSLEVTAATSGNPAGVDPDGYTVAVDGGAWQPLAINGSLTFPQLAAGAHTVALDRVASNCAVSGESSVVDTVSVGATTHTAFKVTCAALTPPAPLSGRIAFVTDRDGNAEIYLMKANGIGITRLTNSPATESQPAWSPDGSKLAFVSDRDGNAEIYVMNSDGTGVRRLTNNVAFDEGPAWSPDGTQIAFYSNRDGHFEIYVMQASGQGVTRLTRNLPSQCTHPPGCAREMFPVWSPDGTKLAFEHRANDFGAEIDIMNADGSGVRRLTGPGGGRLDWSRTGKIVFAPLRGDYEIFVVTVTGATVTQLTNNSGADDNPAWSPDGSKIVFASDRDGNVHLYAMNLDGSGVTRLTHSAAFESGPAWGP
jgi:Tol biopolymer transport system component